MEERNLEKSLPAKKIGKGSKKKKSKAESDKRNQLK